MASFAGGNVSTGIGLPTRYCWSYTLCSPNVGTESAPTAKRKDSSTASPFASITVSAPSLPGRLPIRSPFPVCREVD